MITMKEVREKYPQYSDMSDEQLAKALHGKFYSDMPYADFSQKIGLSTPQMRGTTGSFKPGASGSWAEPKPWKDIPREAMSNVPSSAANLAGGLWNAVTSPVETATGVWDLAAGGLRNALPDKFVSAVEGGEPAAHGLLQDPRRLQQPRGILQTTQIIPITVGPPTTKEIRSWTTGSSLISPIGSTSSAIP